METLRIRHLTTYLYARPVTFGEHRLMIRPRDSHDLRLVSTQLRLSLAHEIHWYHDVFSNSIARVEFEGETDRLEIESTITVELYADEEIDYAIEPHARTLPFSYASGDVADLARTSERHHPDPDRLVDAWARERIVEGDGETARVLEAMCRSIKEEFVYQSRPEEGTRTPVETLTDRRGTCRDFALLMMEAVRSLGMAARFVTGYLYDPAADGPSVLRGAGATHAWMQVFLPGAGWLEYDPTNGLIGGRNLVRVGVTRMPSQAMPVQGSYVGTQADFLEMQVSVAVESV